MPAWLFDMCTDFCRWRARCATQRAKREMARAHHWLRIETDIIKRELGED